MVIYSSYFELFGNYIPYCGVLFIFGILLAGLSSLPVSVIGLILACIGRKNNPSGLGTAGLVIGIIAVVFSAITFFTCGLCTICALSTVGELEGLLGGL